jgi:ABC-2 type transport system permease protein
MAALLRPGFRLVWVRELRRIVSRPIYALITVLLPLGFLLFFTTLMPQGLPDKLPIGVVDHDQSSLSRKVIRQIDATQQTHVAANYLHFFEARQAVQNQTIYGFVEVPKGFMKQVTNGEQPTLHFYYTQNYLIPGSLVLKNLSYMVTTVSGGASLQLRQARGQSYDQAMGQILPIVPQINAIGNPWINYSVYLINVLLPGMLQLMVLLTTIYAIGIEIKKERSLKWYRLSGRKLWKALAAKLLPYTVAFAVMGCLYCVVLFEGMHYPLHHSIGWMFLDYFLMVVAYQAMGIFLVEMFPTLPVALSIGGLFGVLGVSYSGLSFPIEGMPLVMQGLSFLFPIRWFFRAYQGIALNGIDPIHFLRFFCFQLGYFIFPLLLWKRLRHAIVKMDYPKY